MRDCTRSSVKSKKTLKHTAEKPRRKSLIGKLFDFFYAVGYLSLVFFEHIGRLFLRFLYIPKSSSGPARGKIHLKRVIPMMLMGMALSVSVFFSNMTFSYAVMLEGHTVAYVSKQDLVNAALDKIEDQLIVSKTAGQPMPAPEAALALSGKDVVVEDTERLADMLIANTEALREGYGILADGQLVGASADGRELKNQLGLILQRAAPGKEDGTAAFERDVKIVRGIFLAADFYTPDELTNKLSVKTVRTETYTEEFPFETLETVNPDKPADYSAITTPGEAGQRKITANVTSLNGMVIKKEIVSSVIIKTPVQQQAVVGAGRESHDSKYNPLAHGGNGITTGDPVWPVERVERSYVSARWGAGRGHTGWDIAAPVGTEIYFFDGGTVISINEDSGSYGEHFVVEQEDGLRVLYAHCSRMFVSRGQTVSKGQLAALVGATGRTTGSHLHIEFWLGREKLDPAEFLEPLATPEDYSM